MADEDRAAPSRAEVVGSTLGLVTLAVAYPVLDLLGRNANFFVARDSPPWEPVGLALVLAGILPALTVCTVLLVRLLRPALGHVLHQVLLIGLLGLVAIQFINQLTVEVPLGVAAGAAVAVGAGGALTYRRSGIARSVLAFGWVLPPLVIAMFVFASPVSQLVLPAGDSVVGIDTPQQTPPIVVIILDELPTASLLTGDGSIDSEMFPTFARLSEDGTWYRNATTVAAFTMEAVPAILTGEYPEAQGAAVAAMHPNSLFSMLSGAYDVRALETVTRLCPAEVCGEDESEDIPITTRIRTLTSDVAVVATHALAPERLHRRLIPMDNAWGGFALAAEEAATTEDEIGAGRDEFNERAKELFETDRRDDFLDLAKMIRSQPHEQDPSFFFLHTLLPHGPWEYLPSGNRYGHLRLDGFAERWGPDPWMRAKGRQRHLLQTAMVDRAIGEVMQALEDTGRYDDALIMVTADHGVTFESANDRRTLDNGTIGDIAMVPLFVKYPGSTETGISDEPVETVDIVPTILDVLGLDQAHLEGRSLLASTSEPRTARQIWQRGELHSIPADDDALYESLARKVAVFGPDGGLSSMFRFGPHGELVGLPWDEDALGPPSSLRVELGQQHLLDNADLTAGRLPVHISGIVTNDDIAEGRYLALSVNGIVHAIAKTFTDRNGELHFSALVPEEALVAGHNDIRLAEVVTTGGSTTLRRVEILPPSQG